MSTHPQRKRFLLFSPTLMKKRELFAKICKHNTILTRNMVLMRQENDTQLTIRRNLEKLTTDQRKITNQHILLSVDDPDKNQFYVREAQIVEKAFAEEKQRRIRVLESMLAELKG